MTLIHARRRILTRPRAAWRLRGTAACVALLLGGCDFPTSLPRWDTRWLVPARNTTLSVGQLLPARVSMAPGGSEFLADVAPVTFSRSLLDFCGAPCSAAQGATVPKPSFVATVSDTMSLPAQVSGATIAGGTVAVTLHNGFAFDPLRPAGSGARGSLTVAITSGSTTVGTLTLSGDSVALPAGGTLARAVALRPGTVGAKLAIVLTLSSPAGDPVHVDTSERLTLTAIPQGVRLGQVLAVVAQKPVSLQPVMVDLTDIDQSIIDKVQGGALVVTIANPFAVTGTLTATFVNAAMPLSKPVNVASGTTTQRIPLTLEEIRALLGHAVTVDASGPVSAGAAIPLSATDTARVTTQIELTLGTGEG